MISIHRIVLQRLLVAWLLVSLLIGGGTWYVGMESIDDAVVDLAANEARDFASAGSVTDARGDALSQVLAERARGFVQRNFVVVEVYSRDRRKLAEAVNPRFEHIEAVLATYKHDFPVDNRSHYEKFDIDGEVVVQVMVPFADDHPGGAGYFEGVFVVDRATIARLDAQFRHTLLLALAAVLLATVTLYPVIISLNRDVLRYSRAVLKGNLEMGSVLGAAIAKRDSDTGEHNFRVTLYAIALAEAAGVDKQAMRGLILGAFLHDVGKIGISDNILLKPGRLTKAEFAQMRRHVELGAEIVAQSEWLAPAREVIEFHHEKYDGSGYLLGLRGDAIPIGARIFAVVDVFDALTARRPYKEPWPLTTALERIAADAGSHFDPALAERFVAIAAPLHARIGEADEATLAEMLNRQTERYFLS